MIAIRHRIGINAPQHQVHQAFATVAGVASWWTHDVTGDDTVGGKLLLYFGRPEPRLVLEVVELTDDRVGWRCLEGPDEWVGTTFTFELSHADGETACCSPTTAGARRSPSSPIARPSGPTSSSG